MIQLIKTFILVLILLLFSSCMQPINENMESLVNMHIAWAMYYLQENQYPQAKTELRQVISLTNRMPVIWEGFAMYHSKIGKFNLVDQDYQTGIRLFPKTGSLRNNYGIFLCQQRRFHDAFKQFNIALQIKHYPHKLLAENNKRKCLLMQLHD